MKEIFTTKGEQILVDDDQYDTLTARSWYITTRGYACASLHGKLVFMHRIINNTPKGMITDHINRNKLDNRKSNLRTVTTFQSETNKPLLKTNKSGVTGVHKVKQGWRAIITINGKARHLCQGSILEKVESTYKSYKVVADYAKFHCVKGCCCE